MHPLALHLSVKSTVSEGICFSTDNKFETFADSIAKRLLLTTVHGCESTVTTRGLGVLTAHTNAPVVTETPVKAHTLHSLNVLRQARGKLSLSKDSLQCYSLECSQGFGKI